MPLEIEIIFKIDVSLHAISSNLGAENASNVFMKYD